MTKTIIIHHNDRDGRVSAAIIAERIMSIGLNSNKVMFEETDYTKSIKDICQAYMPYIENYEVSSIYIVDVSISRTSDIDFLLNQISEYTRVIWIDHHQTSFDTIKEFETENHQTVEIDGFRCIGVSAAALCWLLSEWNTAQYQILSAGGVISEAQRNILLSTLPQYLQYVSNYDTFGSSDPKVYTFNYGDKLQSVNEYIIEINHGILYSSHRLDMILEKGAIIEDYLKQKYKSAVDKAAFEFTYADDEYKKQPLKGIALNYGTFSSLVFGNKINEYDIACIYQQYGANEVKYSLYSAHKDAKCNEIAKSFGGGGHKQAAGFRTKKLAFVKNDDSVILTKKGLE